MARKPRPACLEYSKSIIEAEKLAVLRRTEMNMAEIVRLCPPDSQFPKLQVAIVLFVLLLYTALTLFSKCDCVYRVMLIFILLKYILHPTYYMRSYG